ncbi:ABC transporter permease [Paenibacillus elgii]|uniref:ABC transporter permease n=1 Tax=Paenibacillus elgii TaxID=189691 RepID=UPI002D7A61F8|nr:ABC transporter permease [Paenibacillus elgii]
MTLAQLAGKNIRKNFTNYFLYFASMIFSIVIYFTFVSLKYDSTILATSDASPKISSAFTGASAVLMIFVAIFIWYSNAFFTRKRKKEVGLYSLLGVRKKQIGRMLFYENLMMGLFALVIGILLGSLLSRGFVTILMKVMGYDAMANFHISPQAVVNTIVVFSVITVITSLHGYRLIYRFKLIELFQADKEGEQEPKASLAMALLAVLFIGIGYWLALQNILESAAWRNMGFMVTPLVIVVAVIIGTYLLYSTFIVYLLKMARKNKKRFWNGVQIISTSQLLYRMKGNARTLTIIAVLSATTLTAVGTAYSFYYNNRSSVALADPNSMMFIASDQRIASEVQDRIARDPKHEVVYHERIPALQMKVDITSLNSKISSDIVSYTLISNTAFNKLAELQQRKDSLALQGQKAAVLDAGYYEGLSPEYVGSTVSLKAKELAENVTFTSLKRYNILNLRTANTTVVVSDEVFARLQKEAPLVNLEAYKMTHEDDAKSLTSEIQSMLPREAHFSSFYTDYAAGMESSGLIIFMGGFLGLVFLAATGSIIYFKQLTEANADKDRYVILHKIGVNKKEIRKTIAKQILFVFALPLIAGIAHCAVALTALSRLIQTNLVIPVLICIGAYACMYIVYYFLTVNTYYKIVTKSNA